MSEQQAFERGLFIARIFGPICGSMFFPPEPDEILPLGEDYRDTMQRIHLRRAALFSTAVRHLNEMTDEELQQSFSSDGLPVSERAKTWASQFSQEIRATFGNLSLWYSAPLFRTKDLADFDHWSRSAFLSLDETVWLSVGLEPSDPLEETIRPHTARGNTNKLTAVAQYMSRHKEQLRRVFDPHNLDKPVQAEPLLEWIERVNFPVHPKFIAMLKFMAQPDENVKDQVVTTSGAVGTGAETMDGRERVSLAKLITALAIDGYGFDPTQKRSPIPNEIVSIADRLGLSVSKDTIRKYLKLGAENLPPDWKDD